MRTRTVCGVSRGDPPLKLLWLKDGEPLPDLLGANVTMLDQYSSLLSIPSLSASHSGEYTCVAKNPAAEIKYTAVLQVKGTVYESLIPQTYTKTKLFQILILFIKLRFLLILIDVTHTHTTLIIISYTFTYIHTHTQTGA